MPNSDSLPSLRILVVLPMYGGSLTVGRYCAQALQDMGHSVETFEGPAFYSAYESLKELRVTPDRLDMLENSMLQVVSQAVLAKAESFSPDLVLAVAQAPLSIQVLKKLRALSIPTAMWFVEDFQLFTYWRSFAQHYDIFAVIQKEPFLDQLAAIGVANAMYLPLAAQPGFHKPLDLTAQDRKDFGAPLSFLGAGYPNRRLAFRRLLGSGLKIWGSDWDGDALLEPCLQRGGARIEPEEAVKIFNATDINLNLHSSVQVDQLVSPGDFVNPRTFELAACGAFQLVDRRGLLPELFELDNEHELITFQSLEEMIVLIKHFQSRPEQRRAIAQRARQRVLAEHTYSHRMETLLQFIAEKFQGWPQPRTSPQAMDVLAQADLAPDLLESLTNLLQSLNLPPDVSFQDLVWALRQRQGELSPLETAILFLDEWKKQYSEPNNAPA